MLLYLNLFIIIQLTFVMSFFFLEERGDEANSFCYNNMDVTWKRNFHKIIINHEAITLLFT